MKKLLKLFLVYISIIIIIPNVNAFKVGEEFNVQLDYNKPSEVGFPFNYSLATATPINTTGISFEAYCLDRNKKGPRVGVTFIVDRVMPDQTSKNVAKYNQLIKFIPIIPIFSNEMVKMLANAEKIAKIILLRFFSLSASLSTYS